VGSRSQRRAFRQSLAWQPVADGIASVMIGLLLASVSRPHSARHGLLVGEGIPARDRAGDRKIARANAMSSP